MDLRIIVLLTLQLDLLGIELEGAAFFGAGPFKRGEEVRKQFIGAPKLISHQLARVPKAMSNVSCDSEKERRKPRGSAIPGMGACGFPAPANTMDP
jgi:hypothetical protein